MRVRRGGGDGGTGEGLPEADKYPFVFAKKRRGREGNVCATVPGYE